VIGKAATLLLAALVVSPASSARPRSVASLSACALLTKAEVVAAIGEPLKSVKGGKSSTGAVYCNWTGNDTHILVKGIALIAADDHAAQRYASYKALLGHSTALHGLGDQAATDGTTIIVRKGPVFLSVAPLFKQTGITLATVRALALKALARAH